MYSKSNPNPNPPNDWAGIVRDAMERTGATYQGLSEAIGKGKSYIGNYLLNCRNGSEPRAQTVVDIMAAMGYETRCVRGGDVVTLSPSEGVTRPKEATDDGDR